MTRLFAFHDKPDQRWAGPVEVAEKRAKELNEVGYGIFHVLNEYTGRRLAANVTRIRYWHCEIDQNTKKPLEDWLDAMPLQPSWVIESKRGYHVYFEVEGVATVENWKRIVRYGLVPALGADPKATDVLRLLRAPGYYHVKNEPFLVETVWETGETFTEDQMLAAFPDTREKAPKRPSKALRSGGGFWYRASQIDGREAIQRLSGHWSVDHEEFALVEQQNGNANVYKVDGEYAHSTGAFVNAEGVLFADGVGIPAWIAWYCNRDWGRVAIALRELWPELENDAEENVG